MNCRVAAPEGHLRIAKVKARGHVFRWSHRPLGMAKSCPAKHLKDESAVARSGRGIQITKPG